MSRRRYSSIRVPAGRIILDRKRGTWYLVSCGRILDYGSMRRLPSWLVYLPGRGAT